MDKTRVTPEDAQRYLDVLSSPWVSRALKKWHTHDATCDMLMVHCIRNICTPLLVKYWLQKAEKEGHPVGGQIPMSEELLDLRNKILSVLSLETRTNDTSHLPDEFMNILPEVEDLDNWDDSLWEASQMLTPEAMGDGFSVAAIYFKTELDLQRVARAKKITHSIHSDQKP